MIALASTAMLILGRRRAEPQNWLSARQSQTSYVCQNVQLCRSKHVWWRQRQGRTRSLSECTPRYYENQVKPHCCFSRLAFAIFRHVSSPMCLYGRPELWCLSHFALLLDAPKEALSGS